MVKKKTELINETNVRLYLKSFPTVQFFVKILISLGYYYDAIDLNIVFLNIRGVGCVSVPDGCLDLFEANEIF